MKNLLLNIFLLFCITSCQQASSFPSGFSLSNQFKKYWYSGTAEITSYKIKQNRYGENRVGHTVHVYVTENLHDDKQVKTDRNIKAKTSVLKLNKSKKFLTGIYPYSIMTSVFTPLQGRSLKHAMKISFSAQEWCGHVYSQLNNYGADFKIKSHSYFESEGDQDLSLSPELLEDEIFTKLRKSPTSLKTGEIKIIPSFEFSRLNHKSFKSFSAVAKIDLKKGIYEITYKKLNRILRINFTPSFPYIINSWTVTINGRLDIEAKKMKTIRSPYWSKNSNKDLSLRKELGL